MPPPERNALEQSPSPTPGDGWSWLETILDLHPFPALAIESASKGTTRRTFANTAARQFGLPASANGELMSSGKALDAGGEPIDRKRFLPSLLAHPDIADGVVIAWQTPQQSITFRVFRRWLTIRRDALPVAVLTFMDISGQKAVEEELREALEARDEFFSIATHELKDPLFALQLSIQLLEHAAEKQGEVPVHIRHHLEVSHRQADRLARLIDNLLDVSRIMNHRLSLELEALDLCESVREVVGRMQAQAGSTGTTIELENGEPVIGYFDRLKLEQILCNLLTNALKYGAGKPVTVRVRGGDETATLEVQDRGVGIAPENQERIFRRFERASESHKKASLGLGLYIVRSLVEAHGGTIGVQSEPGQGATFTVTLPRKRLQVAEPANGDQMTSRE